MTKKENQPSSGLRPEKKASASARSGLLAAVSLLGVSLGTSDAAPLDGSGPAASVKDAAAGEKLVQSVTIKWPKQKAGKESKQMKWDRRRRNPKGASPIPDPPARR
jgi:hypothetical protein